MRTSHPVYDLVSCPPRFEGDTHRYYVSFGTVLNPESGERVVRRGTLATLLRQGRKEGWSQDRLLSLVDSAVEAQQALC